MAKNALDYAGETFDIEVIVGAFEGVILKMSPGHEGARAMTDIGSMPIAIRATAAARGRAGVSVRRA